MELGKSRGTDGLPSEFYKTMWIDISEPLLNALNYGFETGQLSISQRGGIINIPKSEELYYIRFTLLNCDYKIAAKAIVNRLKTHLPNLINNGQTGFIKGRYIGENIRLIDSVINYTSAKNIPGLLLFLDFEKAFDTLEWSFGLKPSSHKTESCILNNGWANDFFSVHRGLRQGCPFSPYLFILSA